MFSTEKSSVLCLWLLILSPNVYGLISSRVYHHLLDRCPQLLFANPISPKDRLDSPESPSRLFVIFAMVAPPLHPVVSPSGNIEPRIRE
jgi:hypothetical protein